MKARHVTGCSKRYSIDLPSHMAECDANFLRLRKLFPSLREQDRCAFEVPDGERATEVRLDVLERSPYTTVIRLAQLPDDAWGTRPAFTVRLYHDARSAEVIEYQHERRFNVVNDYPNARMHQPDEKVQVNRLLGEFLSACLTHGVSFSDSALTT